ncbi:hypothetical protein LTR95_009912 [Oleoguttula sp. CCFEE 5521]
MCSVILIYTLFLAHLLLDQITPVSPSPSLSGFETFPELGYPAPIVEYTTESDIDRTMRINIPEWTSAYKGDPIEAHLLPTALLAIFVATCTLLQWALSDLFSSDLSNNMPRRENANQRNRVAESVPAAPTHMPPISPTPHASKSLQEDVDITTSNPSKPVRELEIEPEATLAPTHQATESVLECVDRTTSDPPTPLEAPKPKPESEPFDLGIKLPTSRSPSPSLSDTQDTTLDTTEYQESSFTTPIPPTESRKTRRGKRGSGDSEAAKASKTARDTRRKERRAVKKAEAVEEEYTILFTTYKDPGQSTYPPR